MTFVFYILAAMLVFLSYRLFRLFQEGASKAPLRLRSVRDRHRTVQGDG